MTQVDPHAIDTPARPGPGVAVRPTEVGRAASPKVSVLIVNWNRYDDVQFCLSGLRRLNYPDFEIILVDNGSTDGSPEKLAGEPDVRLIRLPSNAGPAAARNAGIRNVRGKYVLLIDSDAVPAENLLRVCVDRMEHEPDLGIVGCRVLNYDSRRIDQWVYAQPYNTHGNRPFDTYAFSAAGAVIRTDLLQRLDGFWEELFMYNEEVDLALRVIRAGYRVTYEPDAHVLHRPSTSGRVDRTGYYVYQVRNWIWIFFRHYPFVTRWRKTVMYSGLYLLKGVISGYWRACLKGIWWGLAGRHRSVASGEAKMSVEDVRAFDRLNRRRTLRFGSNRNAGVSAAMDDSQIAFDFKAAAARTPTLGKHQTV